MTLLEALVALVILGLAAIGFLGAFQVTARSTASAGEWVQAVGYAEAEMEQTKLGRAARQVQPWPGAIGIDLITVTVAVPGGGTFVLQRLVRAQ